MRRAKRAAVAIRQRFEPAGLGFARISGHGFGSGAQLSWSYLPTKRPDCTKYFIVLAALRPDDQQTDSGASMPLFPAVFFATLIAAIVYVAGRHLVSDDPE
jgi:hypothetical protein